MNISQCSNTCQFLNVSYVYREGNEKLDGRENASWRHKYPPLRLQSQIYKQTNSPASVGSIGKPSRARIVPYLSHIELFLSLF